MSAFPGGCSVYITFPQAPSPRPGQALSRWERGSRDRGLLPFATLLSYGKGAGEIAKAINGFSHRPASLYEIATLVRQAGWRSG